MIANIGVCRSIHIKNTVERAPAYALAVWASGHQETEIAQQRTVTERLSQWCWRWNWLQVI